MSSKKNDQQKHPAKDAAGSSKATLPTLPKLPAAAGADVDTDSQADQQEEAPPQFGLMSKLQSVIDAADDDEEGDTGFEDLQASITFGGVSATMHVPKAHSLRFKAVKYAAVILLTYPAGGPSACDQKQGSKAAAEAACHPARAASVICQPGEM